MDDDRLTVSVQRYDAERGAVADVEDGEVMVTVEDGEVHIWGDPAGLRDLARWCLAVSDESSPAGSHIHLDAGTVPLAFGSSSLCIGRPLDST